GDDLCPEAGIRGRARRRAGGLLPVNRQRIGLHLPPQREFSRGGRQGSVFCRVGGKFVQREGKCLRFGRLERDLRAKNADPVDVSRPVGGELLVGELVEI